MTHTLHQTVVGVGTPHDVFRRRFLDLLQDCIGSLFFFFIHCVLVVYRLPNKTLQATAAAPACCGRFMFIGCPFSFPRPRPAAVPELGR